MGLGVQDLNDLYYFAKVVEKGGFAAAARSLGLPKSRLSRRVALLESALGVRLLQRTTRRLALTEVGRLYYQHAQNVMAEADAAVEAVDRVRRVPSGLLRVTCLVGLAQSEVGALVPEFLATYPEVNLDLVVTNRRVQLIEEGVDIALRVRPADDEEPGLVVRRLQPAPLVLVVHPELLEASGPIDDPDDLTRLPMMGFGSPDGRTRLALVGPGGERREALNVDLRCCATRRSPGSVRRCCPLPSAWTTSGLVGWYHCSPIGASHRQPCRRSTSVGAGWCRPCGLSSIC